MCEDDRELMSTIFKRGGMYKRWANKQLTDYKHTDLPPTVRSRAVDLLLRTNGNVYKKLGRAGE